MNELLMDLPVKELLEKAADKFGLSYSKYQDPCEYYPEWGIFPVGGCDHTDFWNPLINNEHAFQLCAKLRLFWRVSPSGSILVYSDAGISGDFLYKLKLQSKDGAFGEQFLQELRLALVLAVQNL